MDELPPAAPPARGPAPEEFGAFTLGNVLGRTLRIFAASAWVLIPLAALFFAPALLLQIAFVHGQAWRHDGSNSWFADVGGWLGGAAALADWIFPLVFQAVVAYAVFQSLRGTPPRWGTSLRHGLGRLVPIVGVSLLILLMSLGPFFFAIYKAIRNSDGSDAPLALLAVGAFAYLAFVASRAYVGVQVAVVEGVGPFAAVGRSFALTQGAHWRLLAIVLLVHVLPFVFASLVATETLFPGEGWGPPYPRLVAVQALDVVFGALQAVTAAVTYFALRESREGVGLDELLAVFD